MKILVCTTPFIIFVWGQGEENWILLLGRRRRRSWIIGTVKIEWMIHAQEVQSITMGYEFFVRPPWQSQNGLSLDVPHNRGDPNYIQVLGWSYHQQFSIKTLQKFRFGGGPILLNTSPSRSAKRLNAFDFHIRHQFLHHLLPVPRRRCWWDDLLVGVAG